ncbi:MAG: hypothetical protein HEP71_26020 [Roseivirga sp.]|nr:hypothetical protein [Roseivirga sp.]
MKWTQSLCIAMLVTMHCISTNAMTNPIVEDGDLATRIQTHVDDMPQHFRNLGEGTTYSDPTNQEVIDFLANIFSPLYNKQYVTAATNAQTMDYQLVEFTDNTDNNMYYILERDPASMANNYWGTYVFNPSPDRGQLIIQAPHPRFDFRTGKQSAYVFRQVGAGFLFVSGTHRCSSPTPSGCAGTSSVCSNTISGLAAPQEFSDEGSVFREGDVAHNEASMFQHLTEWIYDDNPTYYTFIQLHGFGQNLDPHVILSNGKDEDTPAPQNDLLSLLRTQISNEWDNSSGSGISLIIEVAHDDPDDNFNSLLGTTNTQGRFLNNSVNSCGQSAPDNTGQFVHIEQASKNGDYFLREEAHFHILGQAIINTYIQAPLPVDLISFNANINKNIVELNWQTGWEEGNSHFQVLRSLYGSDQFESLGFVMGRGDSDISINYQYSDTLPPGFQNQNLYYRLKQVDFNGSFEFSEVIRVFVPPSDHKQRLLYGNRGSGEDLNVNLPTTFTSNTHIVFHFVDIRQGTDYKILLKPCEIKTVLQQKLSESPPGVYRVILEQGNIKVSDKYLRL